MPRYSLRTLLILMAIVPPVVALAWSGNLPLVVFGTSALTFFFALLLAPLWIPVLFAYCAVKAYRECRTDLAWLLVGGSLCEVVFSIISMSMIRLLMH